MSKGNVESFPVAVSLPIHPKIRHDSDDGQQGAGSVPTGPKPTTKNLAIWEETPSETPVHDRDRNPAAHVSAVESAALEDGYAVDLEVRRGDDQVAGEGNVASVCIDLAADRDRRGASRHHRSPAHQGGAFDARNGVQSFLQRDPELSARRRVVGVPLSPQAHSGGQNPITFESVIGVPQFEYAPYR